MCECGQGVGKNSYAFHLLSDLHARRMINKSFNIKCSCGCSYLPNSYRSHYDGLVHKTLIRKQREKFFEDAIDDGVYIRGYQSDKLEYVEKNNANLVELEH